MKQYIIGIFASLFVLASCQERNPDLFMDITGVYFNNMSGRMAVVDSIDVTFVYEAADEMEIPVKVQLIGRTSTKDRQFGLTVVSDNAQEGVDYVLPAKAILPAGALSDTTVSPNWRSFADVIPISCTFTGISISLAAS